LAAWGPGAELLAAARPAGLPATVTWRRPDEVRWLRAGAAAERGAGGLQVLAGDWRSWDGLYRDVRAAWLDPAPGRVVGPGELAPPASVPRARLRRYVALHGIGSLPAAVAERPGLRERFDGLLLDSAWLLARSDTALARERAWLADADLRVVLDFTRAINRFPGLTFSSGVRHAQAASQRAFEAALAKMTALGARDALICSHAAEGDWDDQRQGLERFLDAAAARGITVHWRPSETRPPGKLAAHAALVAELRRAHPNLRIAAPLVEEPDAAKLSRSLAPAGAPELWLLAAPEPHEGRLGVQFLPLTGLAKADAARALAAAAGATVVFDADYLAWKEVLADVEYVR